jgi:hypothetical protein
MEPLRLAGHEASADHADALQRPQRAYSQNNQGQQISGQFHMWNPVPKSIGCDALAVMKEPKETA